MFKKLLALFCCAFALAAIASSKVYPVYFKQDPGIVIDGHLSGDDWNDIKNELQLLPGNGNDHANKGSSITGQKDISGRVKCAYRYDGMYFGIKVVDDKHRQEKSGGAAFLGDHVEVLIDMQPIVLNTKKFGPKQFHILLSPGAFDGKIKPEAFMYQPVKQNLSIPIAALKTADGYTVEAFITWSILGLQGVPSAQMEKLIGLDFLISDTDGSAPRQEKYIFAGKAPFAVERGRLSYAYLSDSRGTVPSELQTSVDSVLFKNVRLDAKNQKVSTSFNYVESAGIIPVLHFRGYNISEKYFYEGYADLTVIKVNGKPVKAGMLRNKPNQVQLKNGRKYNFVSASNRIYLPYTKDMDKLPVFGKPNYIFRDRQDWCNFEFDISSLVKNGKNTVTVESFIFKKNRIMPVMIKELSFGYSSGKAKTLRPAPTGSIPIVTPKKIQQTKADFRLNQDNSELSVLHNGEKYFVKSSWSIPEGRLVTESNKYFTLKRELIRKQELVILKDTIKNISNKDLPVKHFHEINVSDKSEFFLNGFSVSKTLRDSVANHSNSSTFVKLQKSGLGLFALDDITRVHAENYVKSAAAAGLADKTLVIPPGKSITTEIAVIPSAADYFDFINILRRELGVNFQIKGGLIPLSNWWFYVNVWNYPKNRAKSIQQLKNIVKYTDSHYAWAFRQYSGTNPAYSIAGSERHKHIREYIETDQKSHEKLMSLLKEAAPGLSTSVYYHCFIDYYPESIKKYSDDAVINAYGAKEGYSNSDNPNKASGIYMPTLTNKFGKDASRCIDKILTAHRPENAFFYWDEFQSCKVNYSYNPNHWDGVSGDIDPKTHKLIRKKSSLALASGDFRHAMVKKIKAAGEDIMVNSQPRLRRIMKEQLMSFTETAQIDNCTRVQVYTPIQLGNHLIGKDAEDPAVIYRQMLEGLDFGVLYYYYHIRYIPDHHTLTQYMFPITPMELHKGYIIGKEKIITKTSGIYGWNDSSKHEVHVYDNKGWAVKDFKTPFKTVNGMTYTELRLPEDYSAVIIRKQ